MHCSSPTGSFWTIVFEHPVSSKRSFFTSKLLRSPCHNTNSNTWLILVPTEYCLTGYCFDVYPLPLHVKHLSMACLDDSSLVDLFWCPLYILLIFILDVPLGQSLARCPILWHTKQCLPALGCFSLLFFLLAGNFLLTSQQDACLKSVLQKHSKELFLDNHINHPFSGVMLLMPLCCHIR